jgi:TatD DNase family protein
MTRDLLGGAGLIDSHAHLADGRLAADLDAVLARAREAGVRGVVVPATTADDADAGVALAARLPGEVFAAVAIHPNHGAGARPGDLDRVAALAGRPEVVAIGETGLDRYWDDTPFPLQRELFDFHLDLSRRTGKPVIIHARECYADILESLRGHGGPLRGVLHSFTGTADDAEALLALGLHLSFAGMVTFANRALDPLREVAARVPADRLLVETDSPYLSPHPFRGRPNEPARVALVAETLARLRGEGLEDLAAATTRNAVALFRLPAQLSHPA